jgi:hypothetical protein
MLAILGHRSHVLRVFVVVILAWPSLQLVGCASPGGRGAKPAAAAPSRADIADAEQVSVQIERARVAGDWAEVNRHLSSVGYTAAQRSASPSMPFAELQAKAGRLMKYELLLSIAGPDFLDRATGSRFPKVLVKIKESYDSPAFAAVETDFSMLQEAGGWKLAGVTASKARRATLK